MKYSAILSTVLLPILIFISSTFTTTQAASTCDYTHPSGEWRISGEEQDFQPGDVICLEAGERGPLRIEHVHGTAENPIIIINSGGQVVTEEYSYGINVAASSHLRLTGSGDPEHFYGIRAGGTVYVGSLSTDIEVDHIEVYVASFAGFMIKTDPSCDPDTWRENFVMKNVSVHDNYAHNTGDGEGFYIGYSNFGDVSKTCDGEEITVQAHAIEGLEMYNNITYDTGAEGIQVGAATENVRVYNNKVQLYGQRPFANFQNNGVQIGEGTGGLFYNNWIEEGSGNGLILLGRADNIIFNNFIINPGGFGIFTDERGDPVGTGFKFFNNTIINPGDDGLRIYAEQVEMNYFQNNIIVNPGSGLYIKKLFDGVPLEESNNLFVENMEDVKFVDPDNGNFHLQIDSPAVDTGINASAYGVNDDYSANPRPQGNGFDIGAYEFVPSLRLSGSPSNQGIYLSWELDSTLPNTATWQLSYQSAAENAPTVIDNLPESTRSYTITGLTNYTLYTITLSALDDTNPIYTDTVSLMTSDQQIYIPITFR